MTVESPTTASGTCSPRPGSPRTRASWARTRRSSPGTRAPSCSAAATRRRSTSSPAAENAHQVLAADYVTTEDGTGIVHIAPAFGEEDKVVTDAAGIDVGHAGRRAGPVRPRRCRRTRACTSSTPTARSSRDLKAAGRAAAPRDLRPPVPALLALRQPADPARGVVVVRRGDQVPRPDGRAEPGDQLGARRTSRTASSASGWRTPATGRSPATGSGARRSRCGSRTTRRTRASTSTARSTSWSATSACARPTCTARSSTS